ncbi:MAG: hypothetical protein IJ459_02070 [Clostridia bacterium]|nr:hypothetical protein [Clostridia bacterium]
MNKLAAEHRNIFARVWKAVTDFFEKLVSRIRRVGEYSSRTPEQRIVEQGAAKLQRALENKFVTALREANTAAKAVSDVKAAEKAKADVVTADGSNSAKTGENPAVTNTNGDNMSVSEEKRDYSFAGEKAKNANITRLDIAKRMIADGVGSETVRKNTGWFKGYDGKWRFEINDNDFELALNGKYSRDANVRRYAELVEKVYFTVTATEAESRELDELDKMLEGKSITPNKLGDLIWHPALFEAYPQLADVEVYFHSGDAATASYHPGFKEISLPQRMRPDIKQLKKTLMHEIQHAIQDIEGFAGGSNVEMFNNTENRTAMEQYRATAGEIEARDTADRISLTEEERKNTRPDIDREDVVFVRADEVEFFAKDEYDPETAGIREQLLHSQDVLNKMPIVFYSTVPTNIGSDKYEAGNYAIDELKKYGFQADRQNFGKIYFEESDIRGAMNYLDTDEEKVSIIAIYRVLKRGIQIGEHGNHKLRGKHTVTFAAPVELNGIRGNMAVVVNMRNNHYKVHRILMPDGSIFKFSENKKDTKRESQKGVPNGSLANATSFVSSSIIPDSAEKSNSFAEKILKNSSEKSLSLADKLDREALAEAFYGLASTDEEREAMRQYRAEIEDIDDKLSERARLLRRYDEIGDKRTFAGERERLREQIDRITDDVTRKDRKLLEISAAKPFRDMVERYEKNIGNRRNTAGTVTMSRGEYEKNRAKFTHSRFYSKADAREALRNIPETKTIREKTRAQLVDELWIGLNAADGELERTDFIVMMKDKIRDAILDEAVADNPEYERQREILEKIKPYISHLTFEKGVYNAITYKLGKEKARSYFGRWSNKHKGESGIDSDRFVEEIIRYVPEFMRLRTMDTADALIELDAIYTEAIEEERYISAIDDTSSREITELNSKIVDELLSAYRELGLESPYVKELKEGRKAKRQLDNARKHAENMEEIYEARKERFKEKYNGMVDYFKATLALDRVARSIRDAKLGTFENATEVRGDRVSGLLRELARFEYRQTFSPNKVRAKIAELRDWYHTGNEFLEYKDEQNPGYYLPGIRELLDELVVDEQGNVKKGKLTAEEAWNLYDVLTYFKHFVENYNKVFYQGKWVDIVPLAESFMDDLRESRESDGGRLDSIVDSHIFKWYFDNFSDPLAVVRRYDRYTENGFFTRIFRMLEDAVVKRDVAISESLAAYNEFIEAHPNYARDLQTQSVEIYGHKVPKAQAIALYMTLKQKDSHAGFVYNGFEYVDFKGKRVEAYSVAKGAAIEFKRSLVARELAENGIGKEEAEAKARELATEGFDSETLSAEELEGIVSREIEKIERSLDELDREIIAIEEEGFNRIFRDMKRRTDMRRHGFSNVGKGYYFPIKRAGIAKMAEAVAYKDELESVSNISANKDRVKGSRQALGLISFMTVYERHARAMCTYAEMQEFVDFFDRIYNTDVSGNKNAPVNIMKSANKVWGERRNAKEEIIESGSHDYFKKLIADAQGIRPTEDNILNGAIGQLRKGTVVAGLALNGKVLLSQLSSYGAALHVLSPGALMKGIGAVVGKAKGGLDIFTQKGRARLRELGEVVDEYCKLAKIRNEENHAYLSQGVVEKKDGSVVRKNKAGELLEKGQDVLMSPIGAVDRAVVCSLFEACKIQAAKEGAAVGTEENLVRAGEILTGVILDTQQNSISTERSAAMRSSSEIVRGLTMFSSDAMKTQGRFLDAVGEVIYAKKRLVRTSDPAKRAKLEAQIKKAGKKVTKSTAVLVGNSVYMAVVALLFNYLRGKLDDDEEIVGELLSDFGSNLIGGLPLIRDIVDLLGDGYDVSHFAYDTVNTLVGAVKSVWKTIENLLDGKGDVGDVVGSMRKLAFAFSQVVGLPVRNVWNAIYGFIKRHFPELAEEIDQFLK